MMMMRGGRGCHTQCQCVTMPVTLLLPLPHPTTQRRVVRLGKPPRRWRKPAWAAAVMADPPEVTLTARPLGGATGR